MLDLRRLRSEPDAVRAALLRRGDPSLSDELDRVLELDERRRALLPELEELRARRNAMPKPKGGDDPVISEMRALREQEKALSGELGSLEDELAQAQAGLPNIPADDPPPEDTVLREVGEAGRTGRDHLELAGRLVDMEAGAKVAGSRFAYLKGDLVRMELALVQWALEVLSGHGFEPVVPPVLVRERALFGTGFLPDTEQQIYRLADDDLYLAGTSEVALASLHADEIMDALPRRYAGFSPCFRREAGAAGRDT